MALDPQQQPARTAQVFFERRELDRLLALYGRMVAAGEWRDYAIDFLKDRAVFSIFRRASGYQDYGYYEYEYTSDSK